MRYEKATGQVNLRPAARELSRGGLEKRTGSFAKGEIEIVIATFAMHSDGKVRARCTSRKSREMVTPAFSKSDERALRALPAAGQGS